MVHAHSCCCPWPLSPRLLFVAQAHTHARRVEDPEKEGNEAALWLRTPTQEEFQRLDEGDPEALARLRMVFRARRDVKEVLFRCPAVMIIFSLALPHTD